jgi:hypothetical protein
MYLSYLIDPHRRTVERVSHGFDSAPELLASEAPELHGLWQDAADPDSTVDVVSSPDAASEPWFRVRLTHSGKPLELIVAGKGVLIACGAVPSDIAQQIGTAHSLEACIDYPGSSHTAAADWLKTGLGSDRRIPAKRATTQSRRLRRDAKSGH